MSIDRSLKIKGALTRHRNVLSRVERIAKLREEEKWQDGDSAFGLPKVAHRKSHAGKKEKEAPKEAAVGAEGVAATAEAPAAELKKGEAKKPQAQKPEAKKPEADKKADKKK